MSPKKSEMSREELIEWHRNVAEQFPKAQLDGYKKGKIERDPKYWNFAPDAVVQSWDGGGVIYPKGDWGTKFKDADTQEARMFYDVVPDYRCVEYKVFANEECGAVFSVYEGTALDTPRARSMGLGGKKIRLADFNIYHINEDCQIVKQTILSSSHHALVALAIQGWSEQSDGDEGHGAGESYDQAVYAFAEKGRIVDPDTEIIPVHGVIPWYADDEIVPHDGQ